MGQPINNITNFQTKLKVVRKNTLIYYMSLIVPITKLHRVYSYSDMTLLSVVNFVMWSVDLASCRINIIIIDAVKTIRPRRYNRECNSKHKKKSDVQSWQIKCNFLITIHAVFDLACIRACSRDVMRTFQWHYMHYIEAHIHACVLFMFHLRVHVFTYYCTNNYACMHDIA